MTVRIYIAGASAERERVRAALAYVRSLGAVVTFDWLAEIERVGTALPLDALTAERSALADLRAIHEADVVLLLVPAAGVITTGAWAELGYALAKGVPVITSGDEAHRRCLFGALATYGGTNDEAAARLALQRGVVRAVTQMSEARHAR